MFAVHPLHVESVAWIAERKDVLSGVFFMLTLLAYARYARRPSFGRYMAVVLLFACGLMSKPMLVTLPFVLLLLDYWPLNRIARLAASAQKAPIAKSTIIKLVLEKIPLIVLSVGSSVVTFLAQQPAIGGTEELSVSSRVGNALVSYIAYIWQMLWPARLALFYPHPENRLPVWQIVAAVIALIGFSVIAVVVRRTRPYVLVGWLWYLGMLVPVIGILQVGLGIVLLQQGRVDEAIPRFERAIQIRSQNAPAHDNLAKAFLRKGQLADAMVESRKLLEIQPENLEVRNVLGTVLIQQGLIGEAIEQWQETLRRDPNNGNAKSNLAWVFATCPEESLRDGNRAVQLAEQAFQLSGGKNAIVLRTLAAAYAESGRFTDAVEAARRGAELANQQGNSGLAAELESSIALYQSGGALRDPSLTMSHGSR